MEFLAGAIIRAFSLSKVNRITLWVPDNTEKRMILSVSLHKYPQSWARAFQFYVHKLGGHSPNGTRRGSGERSNIDEVTKHTYHLIQTGTIGTRAFSGPSMLATITKDVLILILSGEGTSSFDSVEIPLEHLTQDTPSIERTDKQTSRLMIRVDANSTFSENGTLQHFGASTICLVSNESLTSLWAKIHGARQYKLQRHPLPENARRRPSSILITLDNSEEIDRKSSQYLKEASRRQRHDTNDTTPDSNVRATEEEHNGQGLSSQKCEPEIPVDGSMNDFSIGRGDHTPAPTSENAHRQPRDRETATSNVGDQSALAQSETNAMKDAAPNQEPEEVSSPEPIDSINMYTNDAKQSVTLETQAEEPPDTMDSIDMDVNHSAVSPQTQESTATAGLDTQNAARPARLLNRPTRTRASTDRINEAPPPDTQESMLFPRLRRSKRKRYTAYTAPTHSIFDLDDELGQSDPSDGAEQDSEVTSISSPSSGDSYVFSRSVDVGKKRRKSAPQPQPKTKTNKRAKGASARGRKTKNPRLPLLSIEQSVNHEAQSAVPAEGSEQHKEAGHEEDLAPEAVKSPAHTDARLPDIGFISDEPLGLRANKDDGGSSDISESLNLISDAAVDPEHDWNTPIVWSPEAGGDWANDSRADEESLEVYPKGETGSKSQVGKGRGRRVGQMLAAALCQAGILSDGPQPNDDGNATEQLSVNDHRSDEVFRPMEEVQAFVPSPDQKVQREVEQVEGLSESEEDRDHVASSAAEETSTQLQSRMTETNQDHEANAGSKESTQSPVSRKKPAEQGPIYQPPLKKIRSDVPEPLQQQTESSRPTPVANSEESKTYDRASTDSHNQTLVTAGEFTNADSTPVRAGSGDTTVVDSAYTSSHDSDPAVFIPKSIVDADGSPRLRSRQISECPELIASLPEKWEKYELALASKSQHEESDDSWINLRFFDPAENGDYNPVPIFPFGDRFFLEFGRHPASPKIKTSFPAASSSSSVEPHSAAESREASAIPSDGPISPDRVPLLSSPGNPTVQVETELNALAEQDDLASEWQRSLQGIHKDTDELLLHTNQVSQSIQLSQSNRTGSRAASRTREEHGEPGAGTLRGRMSPGP